MAQTTGVTIQDWEGTTDDTVVLTGATAALATVNWSVESSTATVTEYDNTTTSRKWPQAIAKFSGNFTVAPAEDKTMDLWMFQDVDATYETAPTATLAKQARYVGSFKLKAATGAQVSKCFISLMGVKKAKFALYNGTVQSCPTGWTVTIEGAGLVLKS